MVLKKKAKETSNLLDALKDGIKTWPVDTAIKAEGRVVFINDLLDHESLLDLEKRPYDEVVTTVQELWKKFQNRRYEDIRIDIVEDSFGQPDRVDITIMQRQIPFITDSILNLLRQNHLSVSVMINATIKVRRDDDGKLLSVHPDGDYGPDLQTDKILHLQCEHRGEALNVEQLRESISDILRDVHAAVEDWRAMQGQISETIDELGQYTKNTDKEESFEAAHFLDFLKDGNFTFLGYREHTLRPEKGVVYFDVQKDKSLGILRDGDFLVFDSLVPDEKIPENVRKILSSPEPLLMVLKANRRATVHRHVHMDVILIKKLNKKGEVEALRLFSGLFTAQCYAKPIDQIPYLKQKVNSVLMRAGYDVDTHSWRALRHVLDSYPRDELFQIQPDLLYEHALGINRLNNRPEVDVFIRKDVLQRHFSALVYLPKEQYDTRLRLHVQDILENELSGRVISHFLSVDEKPLARLQYTISTDNAQLPDYDLDRLRQKLVMACTPWFDRLKMATLDRFGKKEAQKLLKSLSQSFSISYQDQVNIDHALDDLAPLQRILNGENMVVTLRRFNDDAENQYRIKLYKSGEEARLSELLPILDRMGFHCLHEYSYEFKTPDHNSIWLHDLVGTFDYLEIENLEKIEEIFAETFHSIWSGKVDSDSFNSLVFAAALTWREANLFRALARYLDLASYPLGKRYIGSVLARYAKITQRMRDLFLVKFDPSIEASKAELTVNGILVEIDHMLDKVEKLDEDRVLRSILSLLRETVRTNYFHQSKLNDDGILVMKFNAQNLTDLPQPRPYREILVYSRRVEAVHLRGGPIARGGLRWSDRYEDFRTEILGLVKAQIVKNAVIVPVGSKGGFICKNQPNLTTPEERKQEGIACYQIMIRGMLSVTDNLVGNKVVPPENTVRYDGDDPYLVVAADKGTATFSDIANAISLEHGFWLGDAFASGGSKGYDHKAMGITAKGAWECIKRHFRELGKDIQTEEFTVVGVGDMSGDVFGNGMLLSEKTKLIAAFDHRHIFVDPNPDIKKSFAERKRLFELPASSWMDFNPKVLSKGGMIYPRYEKSLTLTPEIQDVLDIKAEKVTPIELIHAILRARVEMIYFGGIGTYIKASAQSHDQVGDKSNDPLRVDAKELRCKVIGEGANLAMTQAARIEFAQMGGKLNTDFIDNSAGVDTSDHEVNIKILLNPLVAAKKITEEQRDKLLVEMTSDVGSHVLKNNYDQSLAISLVEARAADELSFHVQFMRQMERLNVLDRRLEGLPDDETIQRLMQRHVGLTRPDLAVLLAYSKIHLYKELLDSNLADDPALHYQLYEYFPDLLQEKFKAEIPEHKLSREIIATEVTNVVINRMGPVFVSGETLRTGAPPEIVAKSWLLARSAFDLKTLWAEIDNLDNVVIAEVQTKFYQQLIEIMREGVKWFILHYDGKIDLNTLIPLYRDQLVQLQTISNDLLPEAMKKQIETEREALEKYEGLRPDLRKRLAQLPMLLPGCDIVYLTQKTKANMGDVARVYLTLSERLKINRLRNLTQEIQGDTSWTQEAVDSLEDEMRALLTDLTMQFLASGKKPDQIEDWLKERNSALQAVDLSIADLERSGIIDLSFITVVVQRLRRLVSSGEKNGG